MSDYPEHDKMAVARPQIDVVTTFLEWCAERGYVLVATRSADEREVLLADGDWGGVPIAAFVWPGIEQLLAEHFGIDRQRIAEEKDAMLAALRGS